MRIAVYTIALNEEQFVKRWAESARDADFLLIADTGSTDLTKYKAFLEGVRVINIKIDPFRFDDARNAALAAIPEDIDFCISLDMDEVLIPGWRGIFEKTVIEKPATAYQCKLTWNYNEDGSPGLQYGADRIHARKGYRWTHPIHEIITPYGIEAKKETMDIEIGHKADPTKSRSSYLPLLEMAVKEDPGSDRNAFYYARELFFYRKFDEATREFKRHLELPSSVWKAERAASYRYLAKTDPSYAYDYLIKAIDEDPGRREQLVELSQLFYRNQSWEDCYKYAKEALQIEHKPLDYFCDEFAWGYLPFDLAAISAYYLGFFDEAISYGEKALELDKKNNRLINNLKYYREK